MYFLKQLLCCQQDKVPVYDYYSEFKRLQLLENAVRHYGGGLAQLEARAAERAITLRGRDPLTAEFLDEIARYLHDVALAGELDCIWRGE